MFHRSSIVMIASVVAGAITITTGGARAADDARYPNWKGQWARFIVPGLPGQPSHDQTRPWGYGQEAPLTSEYQAVLDASLADQANAVEGKCSSAPPVPWRAMGTLSRKDSTPQASGPYLQEEGRRRGL